MTVRFSLIFGLSLLFGCGPNAPRPSGEPFRASDAAASHAAYQAYCGMCPNAETCCLSDADFAAGRWSSTSGTYLRAMRDYYECQRASVLYRAQYEPRREGQPHTFGPLTQAGNTFASCYPHACSELEELMVAELDRALAQPRQHAPGALVSCSQPDAP